MTTEYVNMKFIDDFRKIILVKWWDFKPDRRR